MLDFDEQQLAALIAALPPAPEAWVHAAQELPAAGRAIDSLVERARAGGHARDVILADLENSLRRAGVEPRREMLVELRARLEQGSGSR
jgi:hypothetical protein